MAISVREIEEAITRFAAIESCSSGYPIPGDDGETISAGWIKFGVQQSALGWRTLEFLAWMCTDMVRAGERLSFFPTSSPPYLNTPGDCLSFVIECYGLNDDEDDRIRRVAEFINSCREEYWQECSRDLGV